MQHVSLSIAALLLLHASSAAQSGAFQWSDEFDHSGLAGRVYGLGTFNGDLIAGGDGMIGDGQVFDNVARFDGTRWQAMGGGIGGISPFGGLGRVVDAFIEFGGELVAGGTITSAEGVSAQGVVRWNGSQWSPMGLGMGLPQTFGGTVFEFAIWQGELYAAGDFTIETVATGEEIRGIARWNGTAWESVGGSFDTNPSVLDHARSILATPQTLYLGGDFDSIGGVPIQGIAAWNGSTWSPVGGGTTGSVRALIEYQGELVAAGSYTAIGGTPARKIASFDGTSWSAFGAGVPDTSISTSVEDLLIFGTDLYVSGGFHEGDGVMSRSIIRWNGTQFSSVGGVWGSGQITTVFDMTLWNGSLILGGEFSRASTTYPETVGQSLVSDSVIAFDGAQWSTISRGLGFNDRINDFEFFDGGLIALGQFTEAGSAHASTIAYFDGTEWLTMPSPPGGIPNDALIFQGDLVVATEDAVSRWNGTQWSVMPGDSPGTTLEVYQGNLYVAGLGPPKRWDGTTWVDFGTPIFGQMDDLHVYDGKLWMAGSFSYFNGPGPHLATWDGTTMASVGADGGTAEVFEIFEGDLIVGGDFDSVAGVTTGPLARFDGTTWSSFPGITGTQVMDLEPFRGELFASGDLIQGANDPRDYGARWDGTSWLAIGDGIDAPARKILADEARGELWFGGNIRYVGDQIPSWYIGLWRTSETGDAFCFGDGAGTPCPCGNVDSTPAYGGCLNSAARGARLTAFGSASVSDDTLSFSLTDATPVSFGVLVSANNRLGTPSGSGIMAFDGLRCVGGGLQRHGSRATDSEGTSVASWGLGAGPAGGLIAQGGFGAGQVRHFQVFYREFTDAACQSGQNTTNGVTITFVD